MKGSRLIFLGLFLLFLPNLVWADCVSATRVTSYYVQGAHDFILYNRQTPVAYVNVSWCNIFSDSNIQTTAGYICDGDKVIIDGRVCDIFSIRSSSFTQ